MAFPGHAGGLATRSLALARSYGTMALMDSGWFDSHCHVHDPGIPGGAAAAVEEARAAGVMGMITVGCDRETSLAAIEVARSHAGLWATVGLHPHEAVKGVESVVDLLSADRVVAVGEAGLDYYYDHSPRDVQREAFAAQIQLAHERGLPLVIHSRDAWDDTFDVLSAEGVPERTIFHCFTGGSEEAQRCIELGAFVSFSGIVTFKNAAPIQEAARAVPLERVLVETDAPYLAPVPHRGQPNRPAWVPFVGAFVAELRGLGIEELSTAVAANTRAAFPAVAS
jgi:TatD DNase family protein